jgi:hypothetical protein
MVAQRQRIVRARKRARSRPSKEAIRVTAYRRRYRVIWVLSVWKARVRQRLEVAIVPLFKADFGFRRLCTGRAGVVLCALPGVCLAVPVLFVPLVPTRHGHHVATPIVAFLFRRTWTAICLGKATFVRNGVSTIGAPHFCGGHRSRRFAPRHADSEQQAGGEERH